MSDETGAPAPRPLGLAADENPADGVAGPPDGTDTSAGPDADPGDAEPGDADSSDADSGDDVRTGDEPSTDQAPAAGKSGARKASPTAESGRSGKASKTTKSTGSSQSKKSTGAGKSAEATAAGSGGVGGTTGSTKSGSTKSGSTKSGSTGSGSGKPTPSSMPSGSDEASGSAEPSRAKKKATRSRKTSQATSSVEPGDGKGGKDTGTGGAEAAEPDNGLEGADESGKSARKAATSTGKALESSASSGEKAPRKRSTRRRRTSGITVAVTGAASGIGLALVRHLAQSQREDGDIRRVLAMDERRGDVDGVDWRVLDIRDPSIKQRISGCDVVVHLDLDRSPDRDPRVRSSRNVRGAQTVLTAAAAAGVPRVVLCTSAMVYGASSENPVPLDEDGSLRARPEGVVADLLEVEWLARRAPRAHPGLNVTVVRPATIVGPGIDTFLTRHFEAPRLLVTRGSQPAWQFCHLQDLVTALEWAALGRVEGSVTCGSDGYLEQDEVEQLFGSQRLELPEGLALGAAERLHRLGLTPAPATELSYVSHPWVVSSARLRTAGWSPTYDNRTAAEALVAQIEGHSAALGRRIARPSTTATLGAAGATAALIGTAAVVARKRRRKRT